MKATDIKTIGQAQRYVEGVLNDFDGGIQDEGKTAKETAEDALKDYTLHIESVLWERVADHVFKFIEWSEVQGWQKSADFWMNKNTLKVKSNKELFDIYLES